MTKISIYSRRWWPLTATALLLAGCPQEGDEGPWLVRIGEEEVSLESYRQRYRRATKDLGEIPVLDREAVRSLKARVLAEMIDERLLLTEAKARGITVPEADFRREARQLRRDMDDRDWRRFLLEHYVDERAWEEAVRRQIAIERLVKAETASAGPVTEQALRAYYANHIDRFRRPREMRLQQIVVEDEATAQDIRQEVRRGASFAEQARKHSLGPESDQGGDLGYVRPGDLPASFDAAFQLRAGRLSEVIETEYGFHIFRVVDVRDAHKRPFDDVRDEIASTLATVRRQGAREELLQELRARFDVRINQSVWKEFLERRP